MRDGGSGIARKTVILHREGIERKKIEGIDEHIEKEQEMGRREKGRGGKEE